MKFKTKTGSRKTKIAVIVLALTLAVTGCSTSSGAVYEAAPSDYETIYDVDGASFAVPRSFQTAATAITEIKENSNLDPAWVYLYKNGSDQYLLFSLNQIVIACTKGTHFGFDETGSTDEKIEALDNSNIMGIWTSPIKNKLDYTEGGTESEYKIIANVTAEIVITTDLFGDFVGKLATVKADGTEWSLFVGMPGTKMSDIPNEQMSVINSVARSLTTGTADANEIIYDYSAGGTESTEADTEENVTETTPSEAATETATEEATEAVTEVEDVTQDNESADTSNEASTEEAEIINENSDTANTEDEIASASSSNDEVDEDAPKQETQNTTSDAANIDTSEPAAEAGTTQNDAENTDVSSNIKTTGTEAEAASASTTQKKENMVSTGKTITVSNQKKKDADSTGARASSIYSLLSVGDKGSLEAYSEDNNKNEKVAVTLLKTYTGSEASELINKYAVTKNISPTGTQWIVAVYAADYSGISDEPFIDVKFLGVDGNKLRHAGIEYSSRTYDMNNDADGNMMVYYAVPYNCSEYVLAFGEGNINNDLASAYFLIK